MKAALDAEGLDFGARLRDKPLDIEGIQRAYARFQREHADLMQQVREWYLTTYPPLDEKAFKDEFLPADKFYLLAFFAKRGSWWEHFGEDGAGEPRAQ